jgi:hypothetical protein
MLGGILTGKVPAHPVSADHFSKVTEWGLWRNDTFGDCGPVSYGNLVKLITAHLTGMEADVTEADVFALYKLCNPMFDPNDPGGPGDAGVDMQTMLELAVEHGFGPDGKWKPLAFAKVDVSNLDEVRAAISIFGGVLFGVDLDEAQDSQTNQGLPWDYTPHSREWGGHAILAGLYTSDSAARHPDISVISWALKVGTTDAFEQRQLEECWVVIFEEHLQHPAFQQGVDLAALAAAYEALTGRPFPVTPTPKPVPVPPVPAPGPVGGADQTLAAAARTWLTYRHTGINRQMADALAVWLSRKDL